MSRYRGPRIKIVRRLGLLAGLTNKTVKTKANLNNKLVTKKKSVSISSSFGRETKTSFLLWTN
jgi:hypothetical protein